MAKNAKNTKSTKTENTTPATESTVSNENQTPAIDPALLEQFKAQLLQLEPNERKALLKGVLPSTRKGAEEPEIPEGYTKEDAEAAYRTTTAEAQKKEAVARAARNEARRALKVWMKLDPSIVLKRGRVVYYDGMPEGGEVGGEE